MLKYSDIINQLSDNDKIRILCDIECLSDKKYRVLGIPKISIALFEDLCGTKYPTPAALANSWDTELIGKVTDNIFKKTSEMDVDMTVMTGPKIRINPYRPAVSEDAVLSEAVSREMLRAAERAGASVAVSGCALHGDEIEWIDENRNERFIREYVARPYINIAKESGASVALIDTDLEAENYATVNSDLGNTVIAGREDTFCLYRKLGSKDIVRCINQGKICLKGSSVALEAALSRYKQLKQGVDHGSVSTEDLNYEISQGEAISPTLLDEAVDRLIDLAFTVKRRSVSSDILHIENTEFRACAESTVLLQNHKLSASETMLPLKTGSKVCIIGDIAFRKKENGATLADELNSALSAEGIYTVGAARGYDLERDRSQEMISEAVGVAAGADKVILFLGLGESRERRTVKRRRISIPANQKELLDHLGAFANKLIVVLPSGTSVDVSIPQNCGALLMSPIALDSSAAALAQILSGRINPSGKLANTLYCNTESLYIRHLTFKHRDNLKTGPFVGYRYYDTAGEFQNFPFGHGLSYTKFEYSEISLQNGAVEFKITNKGSRDGVEIAQIYVGKLDSAVIRPAKELCGFARVAVAAGDSVHVRVPFAIPEVYDEQSGQYVKEIGEYMVYVCASVSDVRLTHKMTAGEIALIHDHEHLNQYIHSISNIITDNFKLEAKINTMKKSKFNFIAGVSAIVLSVILKLYCVFANVDGLFFDIFALAIALAGVAHFISAYRHRLNENAKQREAVIEASQELFSNAETVSVNYADSLFSKEFDTHEEEISHEAEEKVEGVDSELLVYIDKEQTFESAAAEFESFALERGCQFEKATVRNIFASLASSRLMVVKGMDDNAFRKLVFLLSSYFDSSAFVDRVDSTYESESSLLFHDDGHGNRTKTNALNAIESARNVRHCIHFAALENVIPSALTKYFIPYAKYVKNPLANHHVTVVGAGYAESSYYMPQNLWFILNLANGESADRLPDFISEVATVNTFNFKEVQGASNHTSVKRFTYYQMEHLAEKTVNNTYVPEDIWKKVDKLEEYVKSHTTYSLTNKMWLCFEKYAYVSIACGADTNDAVDRALCAKLMPSIVAVLKGNLSNDDRNISDTLDVLFGEECVENCKKLIKECGSM